MAVGGPGQGFVASITGIIEATIWSSQGNQAGLSIRHYRVDGIAGGGATLGQIATRLDLAIGPVMKPLLITAATYRGVSVRQVFPLPPSAPAWDNANAGAGAVLGDAMAKQVSGLIGWYSALGGRSGRGRTYVSFPGEADNDPTAIPAAAYQTRLTNLAAVLFSFQTTAGPNNATLNPGIYNRTTHQFTPFTGYAVRAKWATQRRRGDYGRINSFPF